MLSAEQVTIALAAPPVWCRRHLAELELAGIGLASEHDKLCYRNASLSRGRKDPALLQQITHCKDLLTRVQDRCALIRTTLATPDAIAAELTRQVERQTQDPFKFH